MLSANNPLVGCAPFWRPIWGAERISVSRHGQRTYDQTPTYASRFARLRSLTIRTYRKRSLSHFLAPETVTGQIVSIDLDTSRCGTYTWSETRLF